MNKTQHLACRVPIETLSAVDTAAKDEGLSRSEWLQIAIARQLGKRPRHTLKSRLHQLEQRVKVLESGGH